VSAAFTLRAIHVAFFGQSGPARSEPTSLKLRSSVATPPTGGAAAAHALPPITVPERIGAILLIAAAVLIGLKPDLLLNWIIPSLNSPLMQAVLK
jgi:NADH-quinone oxidoreductase subunit M